MEDILFLARFAWRPNNLGYCGRRDDVLEILKKDEITDGEKEALRKWLGTFLSLKLYMSSIAEVAGEDTFSQKVAEAYIIGNDIWDDPNLSARIRRNLSSKMLRLSVSGSHKRLAERLAAADVPVTHNLIMLYFGSITGSLEMNVANQDKCKVSLGTVLAEGKADYNKLVKDDVLGVVSGTQELRDEFFETREGEKVFTHWGVPFHKPDGNRMKNYERYFARVIDFLKYHDLSI